MAKNKTAATTSSVQEFLLNIPDPTKRNDCLHLSTLLTAQTGLEPRMWGSSIVGYGSYHYKYASGHEGDAPLIGFSPRSAAIVLYMAVSYPQKETLLGRLGKHKTGVGCVYVKKLADIQEDVLIEMITASVQQMKAEHLA